MECCLSRVGSGVQSQRWPGRRAGKEERSMVLHLAPEAWLSLLAAPRGKFYSW